MVSDTSRNGGDNMIATNRRRTMGKAEVIPADVIMTIETNPEVLAVCYAQGWCANPKYMTATEAAAVTSVGTVFQSNKNITHFEEFEYFTGITSIAYRAFYQCTALKNIKIPEGVTTLENQVFASCSNIQSITIPSTATSIGTYMDNYCNKLQTVIWDSSVNPNSAVRFQNAKAFASNVYEVIDGMLFKDNGQTLFAAPINKTNVVIPNTVKTVSAYACYNNKTANMVFPDELVTIGSNAFYAVKFGTYLILPNKIASIGDNSFRNSNYRLLYVPPSCTTIEGSAFANTPSGVTNRIAVINSVNRPANSSIYTFTCKEPKWKIYVPIGATSNYPIANGQMIYSSYVQSVSEIPSTFDTSSTQAIKNSLDALDAL